MYNDALDRVLKECAPLFDAFEEDGEELVLVGGAVRDLVMGLPPKDADFSTSALPEVATRILEARGYHVFPLGIEFGTIATILDGKQIEITTYRPKETYVEGSRHPQVVFGRDVLEDLARRDLSMNAMALRGDGRIIDPFDGMGAIKRRILEVPGATPTRTRGILLDDPLRILRIARFSGRLGFTPTTMTTEAAVDCAQSLLQISRERWKSELDKTIASHYAEKALNWLNKIGALKLLIPELARVDVQKWLDALGDLPEKTLVRWAFLCACTGVAPRTLGERFRWSNAEVAAVEALSALPDITSIISDVGLRRWIASAKAPVEDILEIVLAKECYLYALQTSREGVFGREDAKNIYDRSQAILDVSSPVPNLPPAFGKVLMDRMGLRGQRVGEAIQVVREAIIDGAIPNGLDADYYIRFLKSLQRASNPGEQPRKYPRTFHLPWSQGSTDDDKTHSFDDIERMFGGKEVVITEKMDGENTTIYSTGACHARSLDSGRHLSRDYVKSKAREIACVGFPDGWRIMGENLYAKHSIEYDLLPDYFVIFGVADEHNYARPWNEVEEWAYLLDVPHAPVVWRGVWDTKTVMSLYPFASMLSSQAPAEGYVVRTAGAFPMAEFDRHVAKFVRAGHVQPESTHWMHQKIVPNRRR